MLSKEKQKSVSNFKNNIKLNLNKFPDEAMNCIIEMYNICNYFDNLVRYIESSDMKLIVESIKSIRMNCDYIVLRYKKDMIVKEIEEKSSLDNKDREDKIKRFIEFYDRFGTDVGTVIFNYDIWLEKIITPEITEFYTI